MAVLDSAVALDGVSGTDMSLKTVESDESFEGFVHDDTAANGESAPDSQGAES